MESMIDELLAEPREALDVEVKEWLDLSENGHRALLAKEIIALANHRGGYVVVGFEELADGSFQPASPRPATLPIPTIARINGYAFGAGMEIAAACDVRVCVDTATFGMPEVRLGIPSVVEAALLPHLIGWGRTRELLLFGETFSAEEARAWGFVERVAPVGGLDDAIERWLE